MSDKSDSHSIRTEESTRVAEVGEYARSSRQCVQHDTKHTAASSPEPAAMTKTRHSFRSLYVGPKRVSRLVESKTRGVPAKGTRHAQPKPPRTA